MEPADNMENHRVENGVLNDDDSNGREDNLPLDMLRFLSKHFSKHLNTVVMTFSHYFETLLPFKQGVVEVK